jgi:hypothetical protein
LVGGRTVKLLKLRDDLTPMPKNILLTALLFALAGCQTHGSSDRLIYRGLKVPRIRFNPPVGSIYSYVLTSETVLTVEGGEKNVDLDSRSEMTANYQISKDNDDFLLAMNVGRIHIYRREGDSVRDVDASNASATSDPMSQLLAAIRTDTIFARVHPAASTVEFGGGEEAANQMVEREYAEADREEARTYWQQWIHQEIIWKNLDPLTWSFPDSAQYIGDRWTLSRSNTEDINFKIYNRFQLESVNAGIATIRSEGLIYNDPAGTWLMSARVKGDLTGKAEGVCFVDMATGMPVGMEYSVHVEGVVEKGDREERLTFGTTMKLKGKRVN